MIDADELEGLEKVLVTGGYVNGPFKDQSSAESAVLSGEAELQMDEVVINGQSATNS